MDAMIAKFAAAIGSGEQRVLPVQGYRSDAALAYIGVDLDTAILDKPGEAFSESA